MPDVVLVLFIKFIIGDSVKRLSPEGNGFVDGYTKYLHKITGDFGKNLYGIDTHL